MFECPDWVSSQQVAELWSSELGAHSQVAMLQDNMQAVRNAINLRSHTGLWLENRILRAVTHRLRRSALVVHGVYTPTNLQPTDPLSRVASTSHKCVAQAVTTTIEEHRLKSALPVGEGCFFCLSMSDVHCMYSWGHPSASQWIFFVVFQMDCYVFVEVVRHVKLNT